MTYCIAVSTREGLVFYSVSRTNAVPDMLSLHSKMHRIQLHEKLLDWCRQATQINPTEGCGPGVC